LKALYLKGYINGQPVNKMLVDTGEVVNIVPCSVLHRLGHSTGDLIKTNVTLSDFNGQTSEAQGILNVDLTVGGKTVPTYFFVITARVLTPSYLGGIGFMPTAAFLPRCTNVWFSGMGMK
jgi:hypothetical protein